jgi:hypothetical protein
MNSHPCCQSKPRADGGVARRSPRLRRLRELAGVLLPGTLLALMPKCPMCLAAYVALGTGFTLSYTSAHLLLRGLTALCICTLAFCLVRRIFKHLRQKHSLHLSSSNTHP